MQLQKLVMQVNWKMQAAQNDGKFHTFQQLLLAKRKIISYPFMPLRVACIDPPPT
jgi:hypothetical protein